jgi:hypothetical protein
VTGVRGGREKRRDQSVTGVLSEYDSSGIKTNETGVEIPADATFEMARDPIENKKLELVLGSNEKSFGRVETKIQTEGNDIWKSEAMNPEDIYPSRLFLPYFQYDSNPDTRIEVSLILVNDTVNTVNGKLRCYDVNGDPIAITDTHIELAANEKTEIHLFDVMPVDMDTAEGNLELQIPETGGISGQAVLSRIDPASGCIYSIVIPMSEMSD